VLDFACLRPVGRAAIVNQVQERHRAEGARAVSRPYLKIVADYRRQYRHQVVVINGDDWRDQYLSRAHYAATSGPLVQWYEDGRKVYGFKNAEQAAQFKTWVETCGIDWSTRPRDGPIPDFAKPPERPAMYGPTPVGR